MAWNNSLNDLLPTGYSIIQKHRINRKGGGLAVVFRLECWYDKSQEKIQNSI